MKNRILAIVMCGVMAVAFTACAGNPDLGNSTSKESLMSESDTKTVAYDSETEEEPNAKIPSEEDLIRDDISSVSAADNENAEMPIEREVPDPDGSAVNTGNGNTEIGKTDKATDPDKPKTEKTGEKPKVEEKKENTSKSDKPSSGQPDNKSVAKGTVPVSESVPKTAAEQNRSNEQEQANDETDPFGLRNGNTITRSWTDENAATASTPPMRETVVYVERPQDNQTENNANTIHTDTATIVRTDTSAQNTTSPYQNHHTHTWENITEQRYVVDSPAYNENVYDTKPWCVCSCGARFETAKGYEDHFVALADQGLDAGHGRSRVEYEYLIVDTIHHEETGHYETVITGYRCTGCGATR